MSKTQAILNEVGENLFPYIKDGKLKPESIIKDIDVNLNIDNIEKLLRIHFILKEEVIKFIEQLETRIRNIKTTTVSTTSISKKGIRGRIDWASTFSERSKINPKDYTIYVCSKRDREFEIPENLVLKELLKVINHILDTDLKKANESYEWLKEWFKDDQLKSILNNVYHKNIYLRKINSKNNTLVTHRMIVKTTQSRKPLYQEAANLLLNYKKLMNQDLDEDEAKKLLRSTFILPEKEDVLFELYWIIKIIKQYDTSDNKITFNLISLEDKSVISTWNDDKFKYKLYHDSVGSFKLKETLYELDKYIVGEVNYFKRQMEVFRKLESLKFDKEDTLWGGRPDIILEKREKGSDKICVFIGEVKNTKNKNYAIQGLKELLEYMALFKYNNGYFNSNLDNLFENNKIKGALFIDNVPDMEINNSNIKIYKFGDKDIKIGI